MIYYTSQSGLIDCKEDDLVYVYTDTIDPTKIDEDRIGTVDFFEQQEHPDWLGLDYLTYTIVVRLKTGKLIKIKDEVTQLKRNFEFITLKDLNKISKVKDV